MSSHQRPPDDLDERRTKRRRIGALVAASGGAFIGLLDATIVNVAFPSMSETFSGADRSQLSWILDSYFIVLAALMVPAGALADRYGRKKVFLAGIGAFVGSSILCAVAPTLELLVAARVLQGAATAVIVPASLALVLREFPIGQRSTAVAVWSAAAALAAASGPPVGGLLVEIADWRWIFLINLPLGALVAVLGIRTLRESRDEDSTGLPDLIGSVVAVGALGLLTLGLVEGDNWGWTSPAVLGSFAVSALLGCVLVWRSLQHDRPVIDPALMAIQSFRVGSLGMLVFATAMFAVILGNVLFLTSIWDYSVLQAGLAAVPGALATTIVARPAGRLADRFGHRAVILPGVALYALGVVGLCFVGSEPNFLLDWMPWTITSGIGIGLALPIMGAAAVADVPEQRFGAASALSATFRQIGAVIGTAALIAILGSPVSIDDAMSHADRAYLFAAIAAVVSGSLVLSLRPANKVKELVPAR